MDEHTASELGYKRGLEDGRHQLARALNKDIAERMENACGVVHSTYASVQDLIQMRATELYVDDVIPKRYAVDFEICCTVAELKLTLADINRYGYPIVAITHCVDAYTVFFRVPADG